MTGQLDLPMATADMSKPHLQSPDLAFAPSDFSMFDLTPPEDLAPPTILTDVTRLIDPPVGDSAMCAIRKDGSLVCWGDNFWASMGVTDCKTSFFSRPIVIPVFLATISVSRGSGNGYGAHACALFAGNTVECWGLNTVGELGHLPKTQGDSFLCGGRDPCGLTPRMVGGLGVVDQVTSGGNDSCALVAGQVICWGENYQGQRGDGTTVNVPANPAPVVDQNGLPLTGATQITCGNGHACALTAGGGVHCWGANSGGQLGHPLATQGDQNCVTACNPRASAIPGLSGVSVVVAGNLLTCALRGDGLSCWGANIANMLNLPGHDYSIHPIPTVVQGLEHYVKQVALGTYFGCAVMTDKTVQCWGQNDRGQLGLGVADILFHPPTAVPGIHNAVQVTTSDAAACVLLSDQTVQCWGSNKFGEAGNGNNVPALSPGYVLRVN